MNPGYETVLRYHVNGSPLTIEMTGGLTSPDGPIPGVVIQFSEDGEELFTLVLDLEDIVAFQNMLDRTYTAQL